tara:strand:+ start:1041 stop:1682 length:642 start_codon:yes stop_codon:yes gene_type:complete
MKNKKEYKIIKKLISNEMSDFLFDYFKIKRNVAKLLQNNHIISAFDRDYGEFGDSQVPNKNTYAVYGDMAFDTLLPIVRPKLEKILNKKLIETYSYARLYTTGDVLKSHWDRPSCAQSITLNIGGDEWPIYLENENFNAIKVVLKKGDALIYKGYKYRHWREKFNGKECGQVFLHYIEQGDTNPESSKYDFRPSLGLSAQQSEFLVNKCFKRK